MIQVEVNISRIKNEINQIHNELYETHSMTDTNRRDTVNRLIEKLRTLKTTLENGQATVVLK